MARFGFVGIAIGDLALSGDIPKGCGIRLTCEGRHYYMYITKNDPVVPNIGTTPNWDYNTYCGIQYAEGTKYHNVRFCLDCGRQYGLEW